MKKYISLLIVTIMIFAAFSSAIPSGAAVYTGTCGDGLTWTLETTSGGMTISGSGTMKNYSYNTTPWYKYRTGVSLLMLSDDLLSIGDWAFYEFTGLKKATVPEKVKSIGLCAFRNCEKLETVTIPVSVKTIGGEAFANCSKLKDVYYGGTKTEWGKISIGNGNDCLLNANIHYKDSPQTGLVGDVDGDGNVSMKDVLLLRKALAGATVLNTAESKRADVDGDGNVTMKDVLMLRKILAGTA